MKPPASLRRALRVVAAAGELAYLERLTDEALESYARAAAAEARDRGESEIASSEIEDLAAWLRLDRPRRDALAELVRGGRARAALRDVIGVTEEALALLERRGIAPVRVAELRARALRAAHEGRTCGDT